MVKGLEIFRSCFRSFSDRFALIGGTACHLALTEVGFDFRATKDLDIVLSVEALDKAFVEAFWAFVRAGRPQFYRFLKPEESGYPSMLELPLFNVNIEVRHTTARVADVEPRFRSLMIKRLIFASV